MTVYKHSLFATTKGFELRAGFDRYRTIGHKLVGGWADPEVFRIIQVLDAEQRAAGIRGAIAEIGVHHGKLFIGMHLLRRSDEKSAAFDLFEDQHLNADNSGQGDAGYFLRNVDRWASREGLVILKGDSRALSSAQVIESTGSPVRLFSVDGGHTEEIVFNDMQVAEGSLAEGGIVIGDDIFNENWPGVAVGTLKYLHSGATLVPFAIGFNKVFFAAPAYCETYRQALESYIAGRGKLGMKHSVYAGCGVTVVQRRKLAIALAGKLAQRLPGARAAYRRLRTRS